MDANTEIQASHKSMLDRLRYMEAEVNRLKDSSKLLFTVMLTINFLESRRELPDSFDDQLVEGIREYFRRLDETNKEDK